MEELFQKPREPKQRKRESRAKSSILIDENAETVTENAILYSGKANLCFKNSIMQICEKLPRKISASNFVKNFGARPHMGSKFYVCKNIVINPLKAFKSHILNETLN